MAGDTTMKASEADKYKSAPKAALATLAEAEAEGAHDHGAAGDDHHGHKMESVRTATHCGYEIVIKTCYEITVDGKSLASHLSVGNDGTVHTHALPEYSFSSAVDVVKKIIEAFPDEFPCDDDGKGHDHKGKDISSGQQGHGHGGHAHEHP